MATTLAGMSLSTTRVVAKSDSPKIQILRSPCLNHPWRLSPIRGRRMHVRTIAAAPESISDKITESVKNAEEVCAGDPSTGECAAAWDEVEEVSAAASHAREKKKDSDPLENYCKDNPEADECRTYED